MDFNIQSMAYRQIKKLKSGSPKDLLQLWLPWPSQRHTYLWCRTSQSLFDPRGTGASWMIRTSSRTCQQTETTNTKCHEPPSSISKDTQTRTQPAHKDTQTRTQPAHKDTQTRTQPAHKNTQTRTQPAHKDKPIDAQATHASSPTHPLFLQKTAVCADVMLTWKA